ncbi:MAG TPA: hypothetical protein VEH31_36605 [Streptosporangiaceae bacterium]|nr:hypothetical protein [Streptosporangiaceae bacterium]
MVRAAAPGQQGRRSRAADLGRSAPGRPQARAVLRPGNPEGPRCW